MSHCQTLVIPYLYVISSLGSYEFIHIDVYDLRIPMKWDDILWMGQRNPAPPKGWLKPIQNSGMCRPPFSTGDSDFATIHSTSTL